ncbi:biotin transporter BioY [Roseovarius sp. 2305UL8-3]|uniref:biotin transporter BioY n=1 Tax=Roseovarius conchicola TaxID=3121636 RepID=UPI0035280F8A
MRKGIEPMHDQVLTKAALGHDTLLRKAALVIGGSFLIALAAQASIGWPVPMSIQGLAILVIGFTFGSRLAGATLLAYLAQGAMGLPVFSNGMATAALVGPTAGFLYGFVAMAFLAGLAVEKGVARGVVSTALVGIVLSALLYIPGLAWPAAMLGKTLPELWSGWMAPFLIGDAIKAVIAAMVVWGGWKALKARNA